MATILDVGILSYFTPVFVFLFIFAIVFAILEKTRILGKNKGLNSLVAFVIAMLFILTPELIGVVKLSMPWFILLLVLIVFIVVLFLFVGVKAESITEAFERQGVVWFLVIICIIIFLYGLTEIYGPSVHEIYAGNKTVEEPSFAKQVGKIIFHPRSLGIIFLLIIIAQAIRIIARAYT